MDNNPLGVTDDMTAPEQELPVKHRVSSSVGNVVNLIRQERTQEEGEQTLNEANVEEGGAAANEEEENGAAGEEEEDGGEGEDENEAYAAEYRSLLFRVADMEAQEEQRTRQEGFALRMARREAQLMSRVVQQQQLFLAACTLQKTTPTASSVDEDNQNGKRRKMTVHADDSVTTAHTPTEAVAHAMEKDASLLCTAYRAERAQQRKRQQVEVAAQLEAHMNVVEHEMEYTTQLRDKAEEIVSRLREESGIDGLFTLLVFPEDSASLSLSTSSTDTWQKHSSSLTTLGGTLARVHTLFHDTVCRTNMAVVASQLTQVGRHSQLLLRELQSLTQREAQLEAALQYSRCCTVEWGIYAAHVQQAREMHDIHSSVTVSEMRAMALRKLLLRRRQELQNALTVTLLREAERVMHSRCSSHGSTTLPRATVGENAAGGVSLISSPMAEVTAEKMKTLADDCARREALRDRLWRELLFLKKCARRELGVEWVAQWEAVALCQAARAVNGEEAVEDDMRRLTETLEDNLRASTYDGVARVVLLAAQLPLLNSDNVEEGSTNANLENDRDNEEEGSNSEERDLMPTQTPSQLPLSPTAAYPPRVRALALLESMQTRVNSLTSLLIENAKHWQRVTDMRTEVECGSSPREETWLRTAELLIRRCSNTNSGSNGEDNSVSSSYEAPTQSILLEMEQHLLDTFHTAESQILANVNAGLANLHMQCTVPLQRAKREIVLFVRLLQLADEALLENCNSRNRSAETTWQQSEKGTRTTTALERVLQLLCGEAEVAQSFSTPSPTTHTDTPNAFETLLNKSGNSTSPFSPRTTTNATTDLPCVCLPQFPQDTDTLQAAIAAVSADWHDALNADIAALRTNVATKQENLEQYAQYSMADVPVLLEKARAEVKTLKEKLSGLSAQSSRVDALAQEIREQQRLLELRVGGERSVLKAAVSRVHEEQAALEAEVVFLRACKVICDSERMERQSTCAAESAKRTALIAQVDDFFVHSLASAIVKNEDGTQAVNVSPQSNSFDASYDERVKAEETGEKTTMQEAEEEEEEGQKEEHEEASYKYDVAYDEQGRKANIAEADEVCDFAPSKFFDASDDGYGDDNEDKPDGGLPAEEQAEEDDARRGSKNSPSNQNNEDITFAVETSTPSVLANVNNNNNSDVNNSSSANGAAAADEESIYVDTVGSVTPFAHEDKDDQGNAKVAEEAAEEEEEKQISATTNAAGGIAASTQYEEKEEQEEEEQHSISAAFATKRTGEVDRKRDEEGMLQPKGESEQVGCSSVLGDCVGVLGVAGSAPSLQPPLPQPVLPAPPADTSTDAVLDDNPFYTGFGFGDA